MTDDRRNMVVATVKPWNVALYQDRFGHDPRWHLITSPDELTAVKLAKISPRWVFFPHWSWVVPTDIVDKFECVCFHMADVPYGRGGSPLQNLIVRGHRDTKISALRMVDELDAGPVYMKSPLNLAGSAQEIFERAAAHIFDMIETIVAEQPKPVPQQGEAVVFKRRRPEQSRLPETGTLEALHDHIRMMDAETYPKAFLELEGFRLEFDRACLEDERLVGRVVIRARSHG